MQVQLLAGPGCAAACAGFQPVAAAGAARPYAGSALESLQEAAAKMRKAAASSAEAVKAAGSSISHAPDAVYNALPKPAQQLVNAAQVGGYEHTTTAGWPLLAHPLPSLATVLLLPPFYPPNPPAAPQMPGAVNRVLSLQLTALWQNHGNAAIALGAAGACYGLWRALLGASSVFVDVGDGAATGGMLALAASGVAFGYLYLRRRYTIDPQVGGRWGTAGTGAWHATAAARIGQSMHISMQQPRPGGRMPLCCPLLSCTLQGWNLTV